jgi:hypothetical protein
MKNSVSKNNASKKQLFGQYNTPNNTVSELFKKIINIDYFEYNFMEPSFGSGNILQYVKANCNFKHIYGYEIDSDYKYLLDELNSDTTTLKIGNFYDVKYEDINTPIFYFGNPPYRTPNQSSKTHPEVIKKLKTKFSISSIKEEAVFFILHTIDISPIGSQIFYILPKTIFQNPTKAFNSFRNIFKNHVTLKSITDIDNVFENVDQDLVICHFICENPQIRNYSIEYNNTKINLDDFWYDDVFTYNDIFKKTYLGSVPTESIFLSCHNESLESFKLRIENIFNENTIVTKENLVELLSYNGSPHLGELKKQNIEKIKTVLGYISEIKNDMEFDKSIFSDIQNYKTIQHRKENRFYFRHERLKKCNFVYLLNSCPEISFYFTGNPTKISTDYFGYTNYDVNRNSSPGALRTIPLENIKENIKDEFLNFWCNNTNRPVTDIFEYLLRVSKSEWWLKRKKRLNKQYFCIPKQIIIEDFKKIVEINIEQ